MSEYSHIGIDLGGTKIEGVILNQGFLLPGSVPENHLMERERISTATQGGYEAIRNQVLQLIRRLLRKAAVSENQVTIGIGLPGHISRRTGRVKNANTTCLIDRDLWREVQDRLTCPVGFENDANCFTLAEATWGAARGSELVFGVIMGTGVGGGLSIRGEVYSGDQGIAGEWGHTLLVTGGRQCYCGKRGCVETYLSGPGLERTLKEEAGIILTAREFNLQLAAGERPRDAAIQSALDSYLEHFGQALSTVINILDPQMVVLGGGMSNLELLYTQGIEKVKHHVFNDELLTPIVGARLGDAAGVFGAALVGARQLRG